MILDPLSPGGWGRQGDGPSEAERKRRERERERETERLAGQTKYLPRFHDWLHIPSGSPVSVFISDSESGGILIVWKRSERWWHCVRMSVCSGSLRLIKWSWKINQVKVKHPLIKELRFVAECTAVRQTQTRGIRQKVNCDYPLVELDCFLNKQIANRNNITLSHCVWLYDRAPTHS